MLKAISIKFFVSSHTTLIAVSLILSSHAILAVVSYFSLQLAHLVEHQLLDEQVKSIYQLASYVTRLGSFDKNYQLGEYLFDQRLK